MINEKLKSILEKKTKLMDLKGVVSSEDRTDSIELQRKIRKGEEIDFS